MVLIHLGCACELVFGGEGVGGLSLYFDIFKKLKEQNDIICSCIMLFFTKKNIYITYIDLAL